VAYGPDAWRLKKDETGVVTGIERLPILFVSCDAGDADNDGVPDLPADGKSETAITVKTSDKADVAVTFRTTRGALDQRTATTSGGAASVHLRAATETVSLTITATAPGYRPGRLDLEFTPVETVAPSPAPTPEPAPTPTPAPRRAPRGKKAVRAS
jgi:hypothetical protein